MTSISSPHRPSPLAAAVSKSSAVQLPLRSNGQRVVNSTTNPNSSSPEVAYSPIDASYTRQFHASNFHAPLQPQYVKPIAYGPSHLGMPVVDGLAVPPTAYPPRPHQSSVFVSATPQPDHKHRTSRRARRTASHSPSPWYQRFFGLPPSRTAVRSDKKSGTKRVMSTYELKERSGLIVQIDSDDETNWDDDAAARKVWQQRTGPMRDRPVDDLLITFQDLFRCFAPIFESCGCTRRKPRRALAAKSTPLNTGAKLEAVCLDCGNVIDAKVMPRTVNMEIGDRGCTSHQAFLQGVPGEENHPAENTITYDGYREWSVVPRVKNRMSPVKVPLPTFDVNAPPRVFRNSPTDSAAVYDDTFGVDESGRVELPVF